MKLLVKITRVISKNIPIWGVSRSSLYDTFGDKRQVYIQCLQKYLCQTSSALLEFTRHAPESLPAIRQILETASSVSAQDCQRKGCFMVNAAVEMAPIDPEIHQIIDQNRHNVEDALFELIQKGQESSEINAARDPRALARFVFNNLTGIQVAAKSVTDKTLYTDIIENVVMALK